jgi:hypothetical protein
MLYSRGRPVLPSFHLLNFFHFLLIERLYYRVGYTHVSLSISFAFKAALQLSGACNTGKFTVGATIRGDLKKAATAWQ